MVEVIFTDLDGTLLDDNYRCDRALKLIERLKELKIPIIFVSAKTRFEQEVFREMLGINDPFIVEDGSAVYIPNGYFEGCKCLRECHDFYVLGVDREVILWYLKDCRCKSYSSMSVEEVASLTGLSLKMAELAMRREFSEVIVEADEEDLIKLRRVFNVEVGGRFLHVYGRCADKGKAVRILKRLYEKEYGDVVTIGIGNSYTDVPMLKEVDVPAIVKNEDGWIDVDFDVYKAEGIATEGWVEVVKRFVEGI